jgi:hypothetical protein
MPCARMGRATGRRIQRSEDRGLAPIIDGGWGIARCRPVVNALGYPRLCPVKLDFGWQALCPPVIFGGDFHGLPRLFLHASTKPLSIYNGPSAMRFWT